jgi:hypothetical protein
MHPARFSVSKLPALLIIGLIRAYQKLISPLIGQHCRFTPTCSEYFIQAVRKYGAVRGSCRGLLRLCRCHPFHAGGSDPP